MGAGFGYGRRYVWSLRLGGDVGYVVWVASTGLSSSLEPWCAPNVGLNSRGLFSPNMKVGY
jgi:hypothetical protein